MEGLLTAWAAVSFTFFALRLAGGDPVASLLSQGLASSQQVEALRHSLGLDLPLLQQYLRFLLQLARADLGTSLYTGRAVTTTIAEQVPATATLAMAGLGLALVIGLALGVSAAWAERTWIGHSAAALAGLATAMPVALTGVLALLVFGLVLRASAVPPSLFALDRLLLPALVLGFASSGGIARVVQAGLRESLRSPYVLAAKARGLRRGPRLLWHALRPSLPPGVKEADEEAFRRLQWAVGAEHREWDADQVAEEARRRLYRRGGGRPPPTRP